MIFNILNIIREILVFGMKKVINLIIALSLLFANTLYGFKIKTHAFVGEKVIEAIEECMADNNYSCIYIEEDSESGFVKKTVEVDPRVTQSILNNKETFIAGQYGPDAFPDIVVGQMLIHPGLHEHGEVKGFGTGDWLKLILENARTDKELALAYGYLSHAAADTFGHSYVNAYAGDEFSLADGETVVEERHNLLESMIELYTPELNTDWRNLPQSVPLDFIDKSFIQNEKSRDELRKNPSAHHLIAFENLYRAYESALVKKKIPSESYNIKSISDRLLDTTTTYSFQDFLNDHKELEGAGLVQQIEIYVAKIMVAKTLHFKLTNHEAEKLNQLVSETHDLANKLTFGGASKVIDLREKYNNLEKSLVLKSMGELSKFDSKVSKELLKILDTFDHLTNEKHKIENKIADLATKTSYAAFNACKKPCDLMPINVVQKYGCKHTKKVKKFRDKVCNEILKVPCGTKMCKKKVLGKKTKYPCGVKMCDQISKKVCGQIPYFEDIVVDAVCSRTVANLEKKSCHSACAPIKHAADIANASLKAKQEIEKGLSSNLAKAHKELETAKKNLHAYAEKIAAIPYDLRQKQFDFERNVASQAKRWTLSFRKLVEAQKNDVRHAIKMYVKANAQAMTNSMDHEWWKEGQLKTGNESILGPYSEWLVCYGIPVMTMAIPAETTETFCEVKSVLSQITDKVGELENEVLKKVSLNGQSLFDVKEDLLEKGPYLLTKEMDRVLESLKSRIGFDLTGPYSVHNIHASFSFDGGESTIDQGFSDANHGSKHLLYFGTGSGKLTDRVKQDMNLQGESKFDYREYPVVFNAVQLAKISLLNHKELNKLFRKKVYKQSNDNILVNWLRSIDGNEQWLKISPAPLRSNGELVNNWVNSFNSLSNGVKLNVNNIFSFLPSEREDAGLLIYRDLDLRENVFNKLFKGPLTPGLNNDTTHFDKIVPENYHYHPTKEDPFPEIFSRSKDDESCEEGFKRTVEGVCTKRLTVKRRYSLSRDKMIEEARELCASEGLSLLNWKRKILVWGISKEIEAECAVGHSW